MYSCVFWCEFIDLVGFFGCYCLNPVTLFIIRKQGSTEKQPAVRTLLASYAGVFRGARISSLPTNACSTEDNIPFPRLANHVVLSKFWKVDLDRRVTR